LKKEEKYKFDIDFRLKFSYYFEKILIVFRWVKEKFYILLWILALISSIGLSVNLLGKIYEDFSYVLRLSQIAFTVGSFSLVAATFLTNKNNISKESNVNYPALKCGAFNVN